MSAHRRSAVGALVFLAWGPTVWALALLGVYGPQSWICGSVGDVTVGGVALVPTLIWAVLGLAVAALGWGLWKAPWLGRVLKATEEGHAQWDFLVTVMRALTGLSLVAVVWFGVPVALMDPCAGW